LFVSISQVISVKTASEMTYIVSSGVLNSTPTKLRYDSARITSIRYTIYNLQNLIIK